MLNGWPLYLYPNPTRYGSAKSNKCNGINGILEENETAQMASNITNHSGTNTDHGNGNDEARVSVGNSCSTVGMKNSAWQKSGTQKKIPGENGSLST